MNFPAYLLLFLAGLMASPIGAAPVYAAPVSPPQATAEEPCKGDESAYPPDFTSAVKGMSDDPSRSLKLLRDLQPILDFPERQIAEAVAVCKVAVAARANDIEVARKTRRLLSEWRARLDECSQATVPCWCVKLVNRLGNCSIDLPPDPSSSPMALAPLPPPPPPQRAPESPPLHSPQPPKKVERTWKPWARALLGIGVSAVATGAVFGGVFGWGAQRWSQPDGQTR